MDNETILETFSKRHAKRLAMPLGKCIVSLSIVILLLCLYFDVEVNLRFLLVTVDSIETFGEYVIFGCN